MASRPTRLHVDPRQARKCLTQKVGFRSKGEALDAAESLMELGRVRPGCHLTPYLCRDCREWHVANRVIVHVR